MLWHSLIRLIKTTFISESNSSQGVKWSFTSGETTGIHHRWTRHRPWSTYLANHGLRKVLRSSQKDYCTLLLHRGLIQRLSCFVSTGKKQYKQKPPESTCSVETGQNSSLNPRSQLTNKCCQVWKTFSKYSNWIWSSTPDFLISLSEWTINIFIF